MFEKKDNIKMANVNFRNNSFRIKMSCMERFTVLSLVFILLGAGCASEKMASRYADSSRRLDYYPLSPGDIPQTGLTNTDGGINQAKLRADNISQNAETAYSRIIEATEFYSAQQKRLVVYTAVINVVVERIYDSISIIEKKIEEMGGYMQEITSDSITLKVPADKFQDAIAEAEKLGEVTKRDIKGNDVTEEMRDLNIRLQNAEQARDKMIALLNKAESVEDTLKIEKELERITETIELLKGKISFLQNKISFSTLTVLFNSPIAQVNTDFPIPFYWVQTLTSEMTRPVMTNPTKKSSLGIFDESRFVLPDSYIKYYEHDDRTRAMSADGVVIYQYKEKNYKGGDIEFWSSLVRRELVERKTIHITKQDEMKLKNKKGAVLFVGTKQIGTRQYGYLAAIAPTKDNIYVFEAWGPLDKFDQDESKLEKAVMSLKMR